MPVQSGFRSGERTRALADRFLEEVRRDLQRAITAGNDLLPRLRCVHERAGHATPEYRTLMIPALPGRQGFSPQILSRAITCFAARRAPDRLLLAMDALHGDGTGRDRPVLIAEARDHAGTRLFWMQGYQPNGNRIVWEDPLNGGWIDPGDEELILDEAFSSPAATRTGTNP